MLNSNNQYLGKKVMKGRIAEAKNKTYLNHFLNEMVGK